MDDLVAMHQAALGDFDRLVAGLTDEDLDLDTPCEGWRAADLLAHSIGQHRGFATAVREGDADRAAYAPAPFSRHDWDASVRELLDAFAAADLTGSVRQVELDPDNALPVAFIVGAQLLDSAVHAWDLARALGRSYRPAPATTSRILAMAERIPDAGNREVDGAAFRHALRSDAPGEEARGKEAPGEEAPGEETLDDEWARILRLLGRDPAWAPPRR